MFPGKNVRTCLKVAAPEKGLRFHRESIRAPPVQGPNSPPRSGTLEVMCQADPAVRLPGFPEAVFLECGSHRQFPFNNSLRPAVSSFTCTFLERSAVGRVRSYARRFCTGLRSDARPRRSRKGNGRKTTGGLQPFRRSIVNRQLQARVHLPRARHQQLHCSSALCSTHLGCEISERSPMQIQVAQPDCVADESF